MSDRLADIERHWDGVDMPRSAERDDVLWLVNEVKRLRARTSSDPGESLDEPFRTIYVVGGMLSVLAVGFAGVVLAFTAMAVPFVWSNEIAAALGIPVGLGIVVALAIVLVGAAACGLVIGLLSRGSKRSGLGH